MADRNLEQKKTTNDDVFNSLIGESLSFFSKKDKQIEGTSYTIELARPVKELKIKGFKEALSEAIRHLFYVSFALAKGEVKRSDDSFDTSTKLFETLSPALSSYLSNGSYGFKTGLAFGMLNIIFEAIKLIKDENKRLSAERVVNAFLGGYGKIDVQQLKKIMSAIAHRYQDQIAQMTISISTDGTLRMHEEDGVVKFANAIAKRIASHLVKDKNHYIDESMLGNLKTSIQKTFIEAQNIKAQLPTPTLVRCIFATWQELDDYDQVIDCDGFKSGAHVKWLVGDILTQTGIRNNSNISQVSVRDGYFNPEVGYVYATQDEAKKRGYGEFRDIKEVAALSKSY